MAQRTALLGILILFSILLGCNSEDPPYYSRETATKAYADVMLELSPESVSWMPCNMALRVENGKVIVTTHLLKETSENPKLAAFARRINTQLKEIVDFAVEN